MRLQTFIFTFLALFTTAALANPLPISLPSEQINQMVDGMEERKLHIHQPCNKCFRNLKICFDYAHGGQYQEPC
jgi:hypothetical protein